MLSEESSQHLPTSLSLPWHRWVRPGESCLERLVPAKEQLRLLELALLDRTRLRASNVGCALTVDPEEADAPLRRDFVRARLALLPRTRPHVCEDALDKESAAVLQQVEGFVVFAYHPNAKADADADADVDADADHLAQLLVDRCSAAGISVLAAVEAAPPSRLRPSTAALRVTADVQSVLRCVSGCRVRCCYGNSAGGGAWPGSAVDQFLRAVLQREEEREPEAISEWLMLSYCHTRRVVELSSCPPPSSSGQSDSAPSGSSGSHCQLS